MLLIGDVHGKVEAYKDLILTEKESIQLGDFGFSKQHEWHLANVAPSHKVLFGNHDDYTYVDYAHSLGHFGVYKDIFFIRGAHSIDRQYRIAGRDWWEEEELSWQQWNECIEMFGDIKPEVVISHDCPTTIKVAMFKYHQKTFTDRGLEECFLVHKPSMWFFGHYHQSTHSVIGNTFFKCLDELETFRLYNPETLFE